MVAVPLCWAWRLRRQTQLRSTATKEGRGSRGADLTTGVGLENEELLTKNKSQRVTPLLAQRITLTGNSYFWRTAASIIYFFIRFGAIKLNPCEDSLIAATALIRGHTVATHNKRHFEPSGVQTVDPWHKPRRCIQVGGTPLDIKSFPPCPSDCTTDFPASRQGHKPRGFEAQKQSFP